MKFYPGLTFSLLFTFSMLSGQSTPVGSPSITNFSRSDYQAGTQNWSILQDDKGIMHFGNNKGMLEFDGTNWQTFALPNRTIVRSLAIEDKGRFYLGGQDELGYLKSDGIGNYSYTSLTHLIPESLQSFEDIWKIFIQEEKIFFCSEKAVFVLQGEEIRVILPISERFENFFERSGKIYIQDKEEGLYLLDNGQLEAVPNGKIFKNQRIVALLPYQENQSLLVTFSNGLFLMDESGIRPWQTKVTDFLMDYQAYSSIMLTDNKYAIGTAQNGLLIMDQAGNPVMHINKENGLQNNTILSIYQDIQQNLWLGLDNGIDYAEIHSPFSIIGSEQGVEGTGYASIIHKGKLYLGTNQGLFFSEWKERNNTILQEKFKPVENAIGQVWNINQLDEQVVIGQHKGASYLDNKQVIPFSPIEGAWKFMPLTSHPGYAIEGTYSGLWLYKREEVKNSLNDPPEWELVQQLEAFKESARVFEEDEDGHIWVSHAYKGLYKVKLSPGLPTIDTIKFYNINNGLPTNLNINVTKIRNELVFTTPNGIYRYEKEKDRFEKHKEFTEIIGENVNVHRLLEDELGNIWFSINTDFGVLNVNKKGVFNDFKVAYFNQFHEALVDGFEDVYAYDEGNVFIGTEKGFVHYNPLQSQNTGFPFDVIVRSVTSITAGDSILFIGNSMNELHSKPMQFDYKMNDFRFSFSAPYFEKIKYLQYRYMLEGFEDSWSTWSTKTEKEYTNLLSGDYSFKVQARNAFGQVSSEEVYPFTIFPPWYYSWYAKVAYFILATIGLIGLVQYVSRREKRKTEIFKSEQRIKLERKEAEFKKEVKKSEAEIVNLRNEKLESDINHKNSQLAASTMHLVQKSEILMKVKTDIVALSKEASSEFKRKLEQISKVIEADIRLDDNWEQFEFYFDQVHENFFKRLRKRFPELTPKDQKLCAYLRMNLTTKEVAPLLNISVRGVEISRYRLRKKLNLAPDTNLVSFILSI